MIKHEKRDSWIFQISHFPLFPFPGNGHNYENSKKFSNEKLLDFPQYFWILMLFGQYIQRMRIKARCAQRPRTNAGSWQPFCAREFQIFRFASRSLRLVNCELKVGKKIPRGPGKMCASSPIFPALESQQPREEEEASLPVDLARPTRAFGLYFGLLTGPLALCFAAKYAGSLLILAERGI